MQTYTYQVKDYQKKKPFSSFLSGVAGQTGIPLWSFYVNRGQLISSFGIRDKNGAIMEFYPANQAYHYVSTIGFRTFIKVDGQVHEFFKEENANQSLTVLTDQVSIEEVQEALGISVKITYFTLPNEAIAGLVRKVEINNITKQAKTIELIDGLAQILPSGIDYGSYKAVSNLLQSWMSSYDEKKYVFYKLRASTGDEAEVSDVVDGNYYMTFGLDESFYVSDYKLVFDEDLSLKTPYQLINHSYETLKNTHQTHVNQVPSAMTAAKLTLQDSHTFFSLIGYAKDKSHIETIHEQFSVAKLIQKEVENKELHLSITQTIDTQTNHPILDAYFKQCYLDNVLRGGMPWLIETKYGRMGYYLFSRKHGDPERDYNFFNLEPSFYSQGNGNFRDVLQNRRNDLFFHPEIGDFNIYQFGALIQADGYNPLSIEGIAFKYEGSTQQFSKEVQELLKKPFTPGGLATQLYKENQLDSKLLKAILKESRPTIKAQFGEGYWEDHFTYLYDLIDTYLSIYPDHLETLMFERLYPFFVSPAKVLPRKEKYVLTKDGKVRQFGALKHWSGEPQWLSDDKGHIEVNLFGKLLILALNKFGHLDPLGIGLSYEGNKPGWNDAANGIPGLFGSGVSETIELLRIVKLLKKIILKSPDQDVRILKSVEPLIKAYLHLNGQTDFDLWDQRMTALEAYRDQLNQTQSVVSHKTNHYKDVVNLMEETLNKALDKAKSISPLYPTYLTYEATSYEVIKDKNNQPVIGSYGLPLVTVNAFELKTLPHFLEAPARYLKSHSTKEDALHIYEAVKKTGLYDQALKIYQTSESLEDCSHEIGRLRAFTPGWLERESNFLHMTYKYLLGLIKAGLYDVFYEEINHNFTCFMDALKYGRSPIENSSFIATSSNPDPKKHGQGFVSRLTGSTAEVLSMWRYMFLGDQLFSFDGNQVSFGLAPKIPYTYFNDGKVQVKLFNHIIITYHNHEQLHTYDERLKIARMVISRADEEVIVDTPYVTGTLAKDIRASKYDKIDIYFEKK